MITIANKCQKVHSGTSLRHIIIFLIIISCVVYLNTLTGEFVYDDKVSLVNNPRTQDIAYLPDILFTHAWGFLSGETSSSHYNPLREVLMLIVYYVAGMQPLAYHLVNIILHAAVTLAVFLVATNLFQQASVDSNRLFPALAALLFAVHPIHTEVVAWITAEAELWMSLFYLLSFYIYITADENNWQRFILAAFLFLIALLFKLTAVTLILLLPAYDLVIGKRLLSQTPRRISVRYIPFAVAALIYIALRSYAIKGFLPQQAAAVYSVSDLFINIFPLLGKYLAMLILPINLSLIHVFHPAASLVEPRVAISVASVIFFTSLILMTRKAWPVFSFSLIWIVIPLIPILYFPAFITESVFAERYLYLPSAGFAIAVVFAMRALSIRLGYAWQNNALIIAFMIIVVLFGAQTLQRNRVWQNDYTLWAATLDTSPDSYTAHFNVASSLQDRGFPDAALAQYQEALSLFPQYAEAYVNRGNIYFSRGCYAEAIVEYRKALEIIPTYSDAANNLSMALVMRDARQSNISACR